MRKETTGSERASAPVTDWYQGGLAHLPAACHPPWFSGPRGEVGSSSGSAINKNGVSPGHWAAVPTPAEEVGGCWEAMLGRLTTTRGLTTAAPWWGCGGGGGWAASGERNCWPSRVGRCTEMGAISGMGPAGATTCAASWWDRPAFTGALTPRGVRIWGRPGRRGVHWGPPRKSDLVTRVTGPEVAGRVVAPLVTRTSDLLGPAAELAATARATRGPPAPPAVVTGPAAGLLAPITFTVPLLALATTCTELDCCCCCSCCGCGCG